MKVHRFKHSMVYILAHCIQFVIVAPIEDIISAYVILV